MELENSKQSRCREKGKKKKNTGKY